MQEEDIGDGQRRHDFGSAACEAHDDAAGEFAGIAGSSACPHGTGGVEGEGENIGGPSSELDDEGHPEESSHSLQQGGRGEEVGYLGDLGGEVGPWRASFKVERDIDNVDGWASGQEVAEEDGEADQTCDVVAVCLGPVCLSVA